MDPERFDRLTVALAARARRRDVLARLLAGALGAAGAARAGGVAANRCKYNGAPCSSRRECCSRRCRGGECRCQPRGRRCDHPKDCCSERCDGTCR